MLSENFSSMDVFVKGHIRTFGGDRNVLHLYLDVSYLSKYTY